MGIVAGTAQGVGDALLKLVGQHIGVAARFDVQQRADAQQELLRFLQRVSRARALAFERLRMQRAEIARDGDVAKAARGALDVRFQLIERVIELCVALIDQLEQRLDHALALATRSAVVRTDAVEERDVSGNRSCVEQSHQELGILQIRIVMVEVTKLSHLMTDDELQVPERLQHGVDESFLSPRQFVLEHDQQIDVRVQAQRSAPVSAECADHQCLACVVARGFHKLPYEGIHLRGVGRLSRAPAAPLPRFRDEIAARGSQHSRQLSARESRCRTPELASSRPPGLRSELVA